MNQPEVTWGDTAWKSIDTGPGWWPIIESLDSTLRVMCPDYQVVQVKEKFGGLRFYAEGLTDAGVAEVHMAELTAARTCEQCGQPGTLRTDNWYRVLCDADEATYLKKRANRWKEEEEVET